MTIPRGQTSNSKIPMYALLSLAAFLCCLAVLVLLIVNAEKLTGLGLTQQVYYLVLVLMGLTAAAFLFGVLQSSATYQGKLLGGTLRLGGSVVGAGLVVVGGYFFIPKLATFPLTVYVHGAGGVDDIVLQNSGRVMLKLGPEIRPEPIGENGQAYFPAIPAEFRGQQVPAWVESDSYESSIQTTKLDGRSMDLPVKKKIKHFKLGGVVSDADGNPVAGVHVVLPEFNASNDTNENGRFQTEVVADGQQATSLIAQKQGYQTAHLNPTLGDTGVNFQMVRSQ